MKIKSYSLSLRPVALAVAVSSVCQISSAAESPFATDPLHLINKSTTKNESTVKPRIMLFVDDSGSMQTLVPPQTPCDPHDTTDPKNKYCRKFFWGPGNWQFDYRYMPTRMEIVQDALNDVVNKYYYLDPKTNQQVNKVYWNLMTLWGTEKGQTGGQSNNSPAEINYVDGGKIKQYIAKLKPDDWTPTTKKYIQAAKYARDAIKYRCQKSFIVMLSDGDANRQGPHDYSDVSPYDPEGLFNPLPWLYDPYSGDKGMGISFFSNILNTKDLKKVGKDVEGNPWGDWEKSKGVYDKQTIQTYAVGFGGGLSSQGKRYLQNAGAAEAGAQTYFQADTSQELIDAFTKIFTNIDDQVAAGAVKTTSISTPASTSSSIDSMAATLTLDTGIWSSEIQFNKLGSDGTPEKDPSTNKNIAYPANYKGRRVLVNNGKDIYWLTQNSFPAVAYNDFDFSTSTRELEKGFVPWYLRSPSISDEEIEKNVAALGLAEKDRAVKKYRKRTDAADDPARQMGDVLGAPVVAMGEKGEYVATGANDGMVYIFKSSGNASVPYDLKLNYVPAGMEREGTADTLGVNIKKIAAANYGSDANKHIYGVNGGIAYTTTAATADRHVRTLMLGAMGQGARGFYALNISGCERGVNTASCNPVGLDASESIWAQKVPLWESEKGAGNLLGYTVGTPSLYQLALDWTGTTAKTPDLTSNVILAAFAGNGHQTKDTSVGYDSKPTLYIYNALGEEMGTSTPTSGNLTLGSAGEIVGKISATGADGKGALASPVVVDINFDGVADFAYAGDYHGDLYRFDLRGEPSSWSSVKIYDGDPSQPITAAPGIYREDGSNLIVMFGTGSDLYEKDATKTDKQGFFGIYDDLTNLNPGAVTKDKLLKQTITASGSTREITDHKYDAAMYRGWWFELEEGSANTIGGVQKTESNEKAVTQPQVILSSVFFTTRIYKSEKDNGKKSATAADVESCKIDKTSEKTAGTSWLMGVNVKNGGTPETVKFRKKTDPTKGDDIAGHDIGTLVSQVNILGSRSIYDILSDNGAVQNGGPQLRLDTGGHSRDNKCLTKDDYLAQFSKASLDEPLGTFGLTGPLCGGKGGRLIRINTREIK